MSKVKFEIDSMLTAVSYDDVMLVPKYSSIRSRKDPDVSTKVGSIKLDIPIISSPMDTITEKSMAIEIIRLGGMAMLHRFMPVEKQLHEAKQILEKIDKDKIGNLAVAIGIGDDEVDRLIRLKKETDIKSIVIDVANGHTDYVLDMIKKARDISSDFNIIAGSIATGSGYEFLMNGGANAVRVGIGGGCFVPGSKVRLSSGELREIESVEVGDVVTTHTGAERPVTDKMSFYRDEDIVFINGIGSTKNHEYYVILKSDEGNVNESNIHNYAFWIEADDLDQDIHLLIEWD